jgi:hypothetical protein
LEVATQTTKHPLEVATLQQSKAAFLLFLELLSALQVKTHFSCCGMMQDGWVPDTAQTAKL